MFEVFKSRLRIERVKAKMSKMPDSENQFDVLDAIISDTKSYCPSGVACAPNCYRQGGLDGIGECVTPPIYGYGEDWWAVRWQEYEP